MMKKEQKGGQVWRRTEDQHSEGKERKGELEDKAEQQWKSKHTRRTDSAHTHTQSSKTQQGEEEKVVGVGGTHNTPQTHTQEKYTPTHHNSTRANARAHTHAQEEYTPTHHNSAYGHAHAHTRAQAHARAHTPSE